jgi:hypothetical protein
VRRVTERVQDFNSSFMCYSSSYFSPPSPQKPPFYPPTAALVLLCLSDHRDTILHLSSLLCHRPLAPVLPNLLAASLLHHIPSHLAAAATFTVTIAIPTQLASEAHPKCDGIAYLQISCLSCLWYLDLYRISLRSGRHSIRIVQPRYRLLANQNSWQLWREKWLVC